MRITGPSCSLSRRFAGPIDAIRLALAANQQYAGRPQVLRHLMKSMLETFVRKSDELRKAKPTVNAVTHSCVGEVRPVSM